MDRSPPLGAATVKLRRTTEFIPRQRSPIYDPIAAKRKQKEQLVQIYMPKRTPVIRTKQEGISKKLRAKEPQVQRPLPRPSLSAPAATAAASTALRPPPPTPQRQPNDRAPLLPALLKKRSAPALPTVQGANNNTAPERINVSREMMFAKEPSATIPQKRCTSTLPALQCDSNLYPEPNATHQVETVSRKRNAPVHTTNQDDVVENTQEILRTLKNMRSKFPKYKNIEKNAQDFLQNVNEKEENKENIKKKKMNSQIQTDSSENVKKLAATHQFKGRQTIQREENEREIPKTNIKRMSAFLPELEANNKCLIESTIKTDTPSTRVNVPFLNAPLPPTVSRIQGGTLRHLGTLSVEGVSVAGEKATHQKATVLPPLQREKPLNEKNVLAWKADRRTKREVLAEAQPASYASKQCWQASASQLKRAAAIRAASHKI